MELKEYIIIKKSTAPNISPQIILDGIESPNTSVSYAQTL